MVIKIEESITVTTSTDVTITMSETIGKNGKKEARMRAVERKEDSKPKSFLSSIMKREVKTVDRVVLDTSIRRELIMC